MMKRIKSTPHKTSAKTRDQSQPLEAINAASLIMLRESVDPSLRPQFLMIKRSPAMAFAPSALVFPGGRMEPDDLAIASDPQLARHGSDDIHRDAGAVTAIRETIEETGISIGIDPEPPLSALQSWRLHLKAGWTFGDLLRSTDSSINLAQVVPFAHWLPNLVKKRRFDTRFYLCRSRADQCVELDEDEAVAHYWLTAAEAIAAAHAGEHRLVFPTLRNLERLAQFAHFAAAAQHARETPAVIVTPELRLIGEQEYLCIPDGAGYPLTQFRTTDEP
jgi:8-oxo-dGTP pyrophosphatase MutT (NUDIX family)